MSLEFHEALLHLYCNCHVTLHTSGKEQIRKVPFFSVFLPFFCVWSQNYVPPLHVFHVEKVEKNVGSYCKLVTFSFKFVAVCHYILQVVCHLLQVACHYEVTWNCKLLHVLHVVHPFHIIIFSLALMVFCFILNGLNAHFKCELSPTMISVFPLSVVHISFCCG
jgi:amino acid transporter